MFAGDEFESVNFSAEEASLRKKQNKGKPGKQAKMADGVGYFILFYEYKSSINTPLKNNLTQLKLKDRVLIHRLKSLYANKFSCTGYCIFWVRRRICNRQ